MKNIKKSDIVTIIILIVATFLIFTKISNSNPKILIEADTTNDKIAVMTGTTAEMYALNNYSQKKIRLYSLVSDVLYAVQSGRVKSGIVEENILDDYNTEKDLFITVGDPVITSWTGFAFKQSSSDNKLQIQFNEFMDSLIKSGEFDEIYKRWFNGKFKQNQELFQYDFSKLPKINGTIDAVIDISTPPFAYAYKNSYVGFDVEIAYRFFLEYGYAVNMYQTDFFGLCSGIITGKFDIAFGGIEISDERVKRIDFSNPMVKNNVYLFTLNKNVKNNNSWKSDIMQIFYKTFIEEERYNLFITGILLTIRISFFSILLGTILAVLICAYRLSESKIANRICDIFVSIIDGVPVLVLLMFFYYVVFRSVTVSGEYIAILSFTINFAAYVSEIIFSAINTIDKNQYEAAMSLGFNKWQTFTKFIFPQSLVIILPMLKVQITSLIQSISVVGYVALNDIAGVGDIIRGRIYEPFFPLITVALLYYIITALIAKLIDFVMLKVDWKHNATGDIRNDKN